MIYADNAASTAMSETACKVMMKYLNECYANPSSLHRAGCDAAKVLFEARQTIAECICARPREIYFTSGGSESDNQAVLSAAAAGRRSGKMHIISTAVEHHAVLSTLEKLAGEGFDVQLLNVDQNGCVSPLQVEKAIRDDTCLVSVMYANNEIGTVMPVREIGAVCRRKGVLFHTDAVQAAGHIPINVVKDNIDMLSISAHKFHGPKGTGVLYARKGVMLESLINGGAQERGKRAGTENVPAIAAMAAALKECCDEMQNSTQYVCALRDKLISGISAITQSTLNGDLKNRLPGSVSFCFEGIEGESLLLLLDKQGICASSGSACTSGSLEPSHVLLAIGRSRQLAKSSLRLSLSRYNTPQQADQIIKAVTQAVMLLRTHDC
ncbi:MAG: cysteine desulfurase [Ruminococcus sp.]|nr:cysteine desulfurase [Ruminococcus sp.]